MIFKKFIGAVTALVMTMTMFVGLADSAGAFSTDADSTKQPLSLRLNNGDAFTIYPTDDNEYINLCTPGYSFEYQSQTYIVDSLLPVFSGTSLTFIVSAKSASTLTINVQGNGTVRIGDEIFTATSDDKTYVAAVGSSEYITFRAYEGSYIESITGVDSHDLSTDQTLWDTQYTFCSDDATITVTFDTTYTVTVAETEYGTVSVMPNRASAGEEITVITKPIEGYELKDITVSPADNNTEQPDPSNEDLKVSITGNVGIFVMPAYNVIVTATFGKIETLPDNVQAAFIKEYTEKDAGPFASLWEGTLRGKGDTSYRPAVTVTSNDSQHGSKQLISNTTVTGGNDIYLAIVVDLQKSDIEDVLLSGVSTTEGSNIPEGSVYDDQSSNDSDTDTGTEEAE